MRLTINGEAATLQTPKPTVVEALATLNLAPDAPGVAVAVNGQVVRRATWATTQLAEGDKLEVVYARQGG